MQEEVMPRNEGNEKRVVEVGEYRDSHTAEETMEKFEISKETVKRYYTYYKDMMGDIERRGAQNITIKKLLERYTDQELKSIANGRLYNSAQVVQPTINFEGDTFRALFVTDSHWGAKHSPRHYWESALEQAERYDVDQIFDAGDVIEGMSNRPDQVYELTHLGWTEQIDYARELFSMTQIPINVIAGNHDLWGIKSGGLDAVKTICEPLDHVTYLGHDIADVKVNGTTWRMHHGRDGGGSYAISYRVQKIIEAYTGGDKPHVLLTGHDHKQGYFFIRNVHAVLGGALCRQSQWMKATRKANMDGFWILEADIADSEIKSFTPRWFPFYN
jgi:predicted phosphodiesterase